MAAPALVLPAGARAHGGGRAVAKRTRSERVGARAAGVADARARRRGGEAHPWCTLEWSMPVLSPVLTRVLGSATHDEVNMPLRPYQRMGRSVSLTPSLPTSLDVF